VPKILVVDDSAVDRRLVGGILEKVPGFTLQYAVNVVDALAKLEAALPDMILTDLIMPEIDGLELVRLVVAKYPLVPIILITGQGSEQIAVEALVQGAASYVPKIAVSQLLLETVEKILALLGEERMQDRLLDSLVKNDLTFILENDPALVPALVKYLRKLLEKARLCDATNAVRVSVALEEALFNAIYHGNLEFSAAPVNGNPHGPHRFAQMAHERGANSPYRERRLYVEAKISRQEAVFVIRDEGRGFDPEVISPEVLSSIEKASGRGLLLMRTFMDEVRYNATGNEVTLIKRCSPAGSQTSS